MIKLVIHCADLHIRNFIRQEEYAEQLTKFIDKCREIVAQQTQIAIDSLSVFENDATALKNIALKLANREK